ncbi:MAG: LCP family protein [Oscillospiraceae bacterium]|nr:LCP family protein [Oscillospiraceae bacterium]
MQDDRFSDTAELPVPKPEPEIPDPFAEAQRPYHTQNPSSRPNQGVPRRRLNGAASPRPSGDGAYRSDYPQRQSGDGAYRSDYPQRQSGDGAYRPDYPQRQSGDGVYRSDYPQRQSGDGAYRSDYQQRQSGMTHRSEYPPRQSGNSANRPQNPQRQRPRQQGGYPQQNTQIRRASYQEQMPERDKQIPNRRPPQRPPEYQEPQREPAPKKKKRRKHHHSCLSRIVTSVLTLVVVLFALYSGIVLLAIKKLNYEETAPRSLTASAAEPDAEVRNVLLIGTDNREDERGRADTMILLSFSKHNHTVTMTSLMRDSYVSIPNHGTDKLNAAYAYGGATLLMDTITNNYGIPVDDYICVNFKAFVHIADALGGIKVEVSDREAEAINIILQSEVNQIMGDDPMDDFLPSGGTFTLNGKQALAYARIRHVGNADFERTERQRTVLDLMLNKVKHASPTAVPKILSKAMPELKTNMSTSQLYLLSLQVPVKLIAYDMQKLRLPADGTYSDQTSPDGQMVLAVDFDANLQLYLKAIHDAPQPEQPEGEVTAP